MTTCRFFATGRRAAVLPMMVGLGLAALLCGGPAAAAGLTIAVSRGAVSLPLYVAEARGFFKREGLEVRLQDCHSGRACFELLGDGRVDVATGAELLVALGSFRRDDLAVFATISTSSQQIKLIARHSAGVHQARQLQGRRIATVGGTSAQYFLDCWLVFNEIDPRDVTVVPLPPDQLAGALRQGAVDAVAIWEPEASDAAAALGGDALALPGPRVYTQHFSLAATRGAIALHGDDLSRLLRALLRAQEVIAAEPKAVQALLQSRLGTSQDMAAIVREHDFRIRLDQSLVSTMESQVRWAVREGFGNAANRPQNLLRWIEPALLRALSPSAVGLAQ